MKNEMDVLRMDERERLSWLKANRVTLMLVGLVWIGMICWQALRHHETPYFLIAMVPVFGLTRWLAYRFHLRRGL